MKAVCRAVLFLLFLVIQYKRILDDRLEMEMAVDETSNEKQILTAKVTPAAPASELHRQQSEPEPEPELAIFQPTFVLHLGPSKTATTTIQEDCMSLKDSLEADKYIYIGRFSKQAFLLNSLKDNKACFDLLEEAYRHNRNFTTVLCFQRLQNTVVTYSKQMTRSLILSEETLSWKRYYKSLYLRDSYFQALKQLFQGWNIHIVITYRRHTKWLLSAFKESNDRGCFGRSSPKHYNWQSSQFPHSWGVLQNWTQEATITDASNYKYIDVSLPTWERHFPNTTQVLNFHAQQHISETFFCHILPHAKKTRYHNHCQFTVECHHLL